MSEIYRTPRQVVEEMLADYQAITGISLSPDDIKREEVIKCWTYAGSISSFYADARRIFEDFFPGSSSEQSLVRHLASRVLPEMALPQKASGVVRHPGVNGSIIVVGSQIKRKLDGALYVAKTVGTVTGGFADVTYESIQTGSAANLDQLGQAFELVSPIVGVDTACTNQTYFLNGRDLETPGEMLDRIQIHDQDINSGGNEAAYEAWARAASPQVVTATAIKHARGLGTMDVIITAGTTDFEATLRAGNPVLRLPGEDLIATVQAYILAANPTTDDHQTVAPGEDNFNLTVTYSLYDESLRSQVDQEIGLLSRVFIYEAKSKQTIHPTELERRIDRRVGHLIRARRVSNFSASPEFTVPADKLLKPNTITLQSF